MLMEPNPQNARAESISISYNVSLLNFISFVSSCFLTHPQCPYNLTSEGKGCCKLWKNIKVEKKNKKGQRENELKLKRTRMEYVNGKKVEKEEKKAKSWHGFSI